MILAFKLLCLPLRTHRIPKSSLFFHMVASWNSRFLPVWLMQTFIYLQWTDTTIPLPWVNVEVSRPTGNSGSRVREVANTVKPSSQQIKARSVPLKTEPNEPLGSHNRAGHPHWLKSHAMGLIQKTMWGGGGGHRTGSRPRPVLDTCPSAHEWPLWNLRQVDRLQSSAWSLWLPCMARPCNHSGHHSSSGPPHEGISYLLLGLQFCGPRITQRP